jgi:hypothetical protein
MLIAAVALAGALRLVRQACVQRPAADGDRRR